MIKNPIIKKILLAILMALAGYVLLNMTFLVDFLFQGSVRGIISIFLPPDTFEKLIFFPWAMHGMFAVIIVLLSWLVFRSKAKTFYKATYFFVPSAVVLVTVGIIFYRWPILSYVIGGLLTLGCLYYLYRTKRSWEYFYVVILISLTLFVSSLMGMQI